MEGEGSREVRYLFNRVQALGYFRRERPAPLLLLLRLSLPGRLFPPPPPLKLTSFLNGTPWFLFFLTEKSDMS